MGKKGKSKAKSEYSEYEEKLIKNNKKSRHNSSFVFCESDDDEANEDLSLKIVEKAMSRASHADDSKVIDGEDIVTTELIASESVSKVSKKMKKEKKKKKKAKKVETEIKMDEEDKGDVAKDAEVVKSAASDDVDNSNSENVVLRRLLRGPRYFDPPDKSWGACFNCGEDGHSAVNCTSARRKKPCFICGSLEHEVKQCQKVCIEEMLENCFTACYFFL
ncbi:Gag polyprotein [Bienertia sinuspersici]